MSNQFNPRPTAVRACDPRHGGLIVCTQECQPYWATGDMTVYRGIIVAWDEDYDARILCWIDSIPAAVVDELLLASEHEGSLHLVWKTNIPMEFQGVPDVEVYDGDNWSIIESFVAY